MRAARRDPGRTRPDHGTGPDSAITARGGPHCQSREVHYHAGHESARLDARRDNRNLWRIERAALDCWIADRSELHRDSSGPDHGTVSDHPADAFELTAARATIAQLEVRLEERAALVRGAEARTQAVEGDRDR